MASAFPFSVSLDLAESGPAAPSSPAFANALAAAERVLAELIAAKPGLELFENVARTDDLEAARKVAEALKRDTSAIFVLGTRAPRGPAVTIRRIPSARAFVHLARHQFQLDVTDRSALAESFQMLAALVPQVPVYRLRVRDRLDAVSDAAAGVVHHLLAS